MEQSVSQESISVAPKAPGPGQAVVHGLAAPKDKMWNSGDLRRVHRRHVPQTTLCQHHPLWGEQWPPLLIQVLTLAPVNILFGNRVFADIIKVG